MELLEWLGSISNYIGFWGLVLAIFAASYFIVRIADWLSAKLFGL